MIYKPDTQERKETLLKTKLLEQELVAAEREKEEKEKTYEVRPPCFSMAESLSYNPWEPSLFFKKKIRGMPGTVGLQDDARTRPRCF